MEETPEQRIAKSAANFADTERMARVAAENGLSPIMQQTARDRANESFDELVKLVDEWRGA